MTYTDHLRSMAKDHLIAGNEHTADALLAGAEALEARGRVRHTLTEIDRRGDDARAVWERVFDMYEQGLSDAYDTAHTLITEALGEGTD